MVKLMTCFDIEGEASELSSGAFYRCPKLETVVLPCNLRTIGANAFCDCASLRRIALPETLRFIGYSALKNCACLRELDFLQSLP